MNESHAGFIEQGHGQTAPWMDLVNSEEWDTFDRRTDHLANPAWLRFFLRQWHFRKPSIAAVPLAQLRLLRSALRKGCENLSTGKRIAPTQLRILNQALNVSATRKLVQYQNGLQSELIPSASDWKWILAEVAQSFADTLASGDAARIKFCQNRDCRWIFYDRTKAKTRCWCSGKSCGNRERVRRSRALKKH
jgi:predicted RNA-binding Zn ribbon-like protein